MSSARVIGRILSLGYPMPGVQVDNYNLLSAPSLFDYDAIVVEPRAAAQYVREVLAGNAEGRTFAGERVAGGDGPGISISAVIERRREEAMRLLAKGGVFVVFGRPPELEHEGPMLDRWLPLFDDAGRSRLVRAEGSQVQVVDYEHPFAAFVSAQLANVSYRAEASPAGLDGIRVFARSAGGAAVGFEMPTGTGRVIVVPALKAAPAGDKRYAASDVLQAGIRRALDVEAAGRAPLWVPAYEPLPGFAGRATALREAQERAEAAKREVSKAEAAHAEQAQFQRLLWQEGAIGLEPVVLEALRRLRFEVHDRDANALEVRCPEGDALIEIEASEHPVDMAAHHRLRQRIERAIERRGSAPRGILFVNGQRLVTPSERQHVSPSLLTAAETMRYCIVPTPRLYDALVRDMGGDDDAAASFRRSLMATDGLLS